MRPHDSDICTWVIKEVHDEAPKVKSFVIEALSDRPPFISGQYLTVRLPGFEPAEGKSYSISSSEEEPYVRLTVKEMGAFSKALCAHTVGDKLITSLPYGFFYPEQGDDVHELVFVVGGVGITPCMSIIETLAREGYPKKVTLFYSNRTAKDIIFKERLEELDAGSECLTVIHTLTREEPAERNMNSGRLTGESIVRSLPHDAAASNYFICGSIDFTKNMWRELRAAGVPQNKLYTEGFF